MNTSATSTGEQSHAETPLVMTAMAALEKDARWLGASDEERAVLKRIAQQRDRLTAAKQAQLQAKALRAQPAAVSADAPFAERLATFVKLHPVASAAVAGLALMIGPRKLMRYGGLALPLLQKMRR
ncbi:hypothetical protein [Comamonas sp. NoAH]|uniref:hypothetical protein n=1 Tax=Comamonas halotolerans TaxID=3041496 RepID=UPI0024E0A6C3|nr:hypothetical protein [Comamonas sp. NoAH]